MKQLLLLSLIMVISFFVYKINNPSNAEVSSASIKLDTPSKFFKEYSYEYFIEEQAFNNKVHQENNKKPVMLKQVAQVDEIFSYQPIQNEGTNDVISRNENVPSEVVEGVEFIDSTERPFFNHANAGEKVSVIPEQTPLLVRAEEKLAY